MAMAAFTAALLLACTGTTTFALAAKAAFVKAQHLGGIMYWEQGLDPDDELLDALW